MEKHLLPAVALVLASSLLLAGCRDTANPEKTTTASSPDEGAHWQQQDTMSATAPADAVPGEGATPEDDTWGASAPNRFPASVESPSQVEELPEQIVLNSICVLNNVATSPIMVQAELRPVRPAPSELGYLDKSVVDIPKEAPSPIAFLIWLKKNKTVRVRCPLSRGNSYQVFMKKQTKSLAVAPIPGS